MLEGWVPVMLPVACSTQVHLWSATSNPAPSRARRGREEGPLTVHLWGFSPVCRRMCTTSMYWALKGFCSLVQACQRHTNSFFSPWMCSLLMCCGSKPMEGGVSPATHPCGPHLQGADAPPSKTTP